MPLAPASSIPQRVRRSLSLTPSTFRVLICLHAATARVDDLFSIRNLGVNERFGRGRQHFVPICVLPFPI